MKIVTDTSTMFSVKAGAEHGLSVVPLTVSLGDETWLEYEQISSEDFLKRVRAGETPKSSSPPPGLILDAYDTDEEVLHLTIADGLSGAYQVAAGLKSQAKHPERVHVLNSRTLCVPQRILALRAAQLVQENAKIGDTLDKLKSMMSSVHSYLIPEDFDFLRRGGRLTPLAAKIMSLLKAVPVVQQTEDGMQLERFTVARQFKKAVQAIGADLEKRGLTKDFYIGISHAGNPKEANLAQEMILERFPACRSGIFNLSPAFITQGGPDCVAIQIIDISTCRDLVIE